jgi:hypothetical protein
MESYYIIGVWIRILKEALVAMLNTLPLRFGGTETKEIRGNTTYLVCDC